MYRTIWFWILIYSICSGWHSPQLYPPSTLSQFHSQRGQRHQELHVFALPLVIYRAFNNVIWVQLWILEKSHISFPSKSLIKLKYLGMRRVSGEEGKKSQGQEISQTSTQTLNAINFQSHTLVCWYSEFNWHGKGHQCIWCSLRLERGPDKITTTCDEWFARRAMLECVPSWIGTYSVG